MSPTALRNLLIFGAILIAIDLYAWKGISTAIGGVSPGTRRWVRAVYWAISIGMIALLTWVSISIQDLRATRNYAFLFSLAALLMLFLLPKLVIVVFHLLEDVLEALRMLWTRLTPGGAADADGEPISRLRFLPGGAR